MVFSQAYVDLQHRTRQPFSADGYRSYPAPCMEVFLMDQAERKAKLKETATFNQLATTLDWSLTRNQKHGYLNALNEGSTLILTDLSKTILWASHSFLQITGYTTAEVLGRTSAFLQGEKTNPVEKARIGDHLRRALPVKATMVNYRKNGELYVCQIEIDPLRNSQGELTHFLAVEWEI
ncbi:PAS domain-containing protein [Fibrella aquatica]|uniref:PAS domain-containing protein n=1 Tax=Fibrella aquatica TaxID=3242487 RepID=UPI003521C5B8